LLKKYFEDFDATGQTQARTNSRTLTEEDLLSFVRLVRISTPLFVDEEYAKKTRFGSRIMPGPLTLSISMGLLENLGLLSDTLLALSEIHVKFIRPARIGDTISVESKVVSKKETSKIDRGLLFFKDTVLNQNNDSMMEIERTVLVKRRPLKEN
jgi:acyl dehydratase